MCEDHNNAERGQEQISRRRKRQGPKSPIRARDKRYILGMEVIASVDQLHTQS